MTRMPAKFDGRLFLTDGGLETTLIFHDGIDLPHFASIDMLRTAEKRAHLTRYFGRYLAIARAAGAGFILEAATWRAGPDWASPLGLTVEELDALNRDSITLLQELRAAHETPDLPILISGCIGPRGDGYIADRGLLADEAQAYHAHQIAVLAQSGVDMISALTMTSVAEAIGIARAAQAARLPVVISFTLETDGRLPSGDALADAIAVVDAATGTAPAYYMINCAHPTHFEAMLERGGDWTARIGGIRANASRRSHAELDDATELDCGDPLAFGAEHKRLIDRHPSIHILGGCCGTDERHVAAIAQAIAG